MSKRCVEVKCPYCGAVQKTITEHEWGEKQVMLCYPEEGGCDRYFVADIKVSIEATGLKIEGQE